MDFIMAEKKLKETVEFNIEFYDVDSMQVAWHGNYVKFMEVARCALLRKIKYDYYEMEKSGYAWPVVDMHIKYMRPMVFMQRVRCEITLDEYEIGMKLSYKFMDAETGKVLTKAESTQMAVDLKTKESLFGSPRCFVDKVRVVLEQEQ